MPVDPADERRHQPGAGSGWEESWYFDWAAVGGGLGGYTRLALHPGTGTAELWACLVGEGRRPAVVVDADVRLPAGRSLEVRAEGLWADHVCETPLDHWTLGLEAFAVLLDDPADAYRGGLGERVPLGTDLEWETDGACVADPGGAGYGMACRVTGEVLVGDERIDVDAFGHRTHAWGEADRSAPGWWVAGRLEDGTRFAASGSTGAGHGTVEPLGGELRRVGASATADPGADGLPLAATFPLEVVELAARPVAFAPVLVAGPGGRASRLARALCRFTEADGRPGSGWAEWNQPRPPAS